MPSIAYNFIAQNSPHLEHKLPQSDTKTSIAKPFVKWVGGKRQLVERLRHRMPDKIGDYYEPFVGAGALFLDIAQDGSLRHGTMHINDVNESLINCYVQIRDRCDDVMSLIDGYDVTINGCESDDDAKQAYYDLRSKYNDKLTSSTFNVETAAMFISVNKHCFNGVYRVNGKGLFNVPYNGARVPSYEADNIRAVSDVLQGVDITCGDFVDAVKTAKAGDFVFLDSPYAPLNPTSFTKYTPGDFRLEDHERLAEQCRKLDADGVSFVATNHDTDLIRDLYDGFSIVDVSVRRSVNRDAKSRSGREVIISNLPLPDDWDEFIASLSPEPKKNGTSHVERAESDTSR